ncbi:hypothetical protein LZ31DRAFT_552355, partial [Colletotrichum somersetense]
MNHKNDQKDDQRGARTHNLQIRSLKRYHCASRPVILDTQLLLNKSESWRPMFHEQESAM